MNTKQQGILFTVIATIIFGITPAVGKLTYSMGSNGIQLAFLRHLFVVPLFLFIVLYQGQSLKLTFQQIKDVLKVGLIGNCLLYTSHQLILFQLQLVNMINVMDLFMLIIIIIMKVIFLEVRKNHLIGIRKLLPAMVKI